MLESVKQLHSQGLNRQQMADELNVSRRTISTYLKKLNLSTSPTKGNSKVCSKCGELKLLTEFNHRKNNGKTRPYGSCKACIAKKRHALKKELVDYKGGKCQCCGYNTYIGALHFHHLDPEEKDFAISSGKNKPVEDLYSEVDKCILVCANCHAEIHGNVINLSDRLV